MRQLQTIAVATIIGSYRISRWRIGPVGSILCKGG